MEETRTCHMALTCVLPLVICASMAILLVRRGVAFDVKLVHARLDTIFLSAIIICCAYSIVPNIAWLAYTSIQDAERTAYEEAIRNDPRRSSIAEAVRIMCFFKSVGNPMFMVMITFRAGLLMYNERRRR
jgi:hypothetical protein